MMERAARTGRWEPGWTRGLLVLAVGLVASTGAARAASCPTGPEGPGGGVVLDAQDGERPPGAGTTGVAVFALG